MAEHELGTATLGTEVDLGGLDKGLDQTEKTAKGRVGQIGDILKGAFSTALGLGLADTVSGAIGSVWDAFKGGVADAREANQIMAQTEAVIKSTGGAAGVTAQEVADLAAGLSAASGNSLFGDDQIQAAENYLLTFTNVKGEILTGATQIATDMAQALGTEPQAQAMALGKALNDPVAGISALSRVGVTFTEQQKEQIKTMVAAGDVAGAQQVILGELNKEFGGSAKAAADADGGMARLNDRWGEAMETLGALVLPLLGTLVGILNDNVMPAVEGVVAWFASATQSGGELSGAIGVLTAFWNEQLLPAIQTVAAFFQSDIMPILDDLGTALLPVVSAAVQLLAGYWENVLKPALSVVWGFIKSYLIPILAEGAKWLRDNLPPAIQKASDFFNSQILPAIKTVHQWISGSLIPALTGTAKWLGDTATKAGELARAFGENFQAGIRVVSDLFQNTLAGAINGAQSTIASVSGWFDDITRAVQAAVGWVQDFVEAIASVVIPDWLQGHSPPPLADWFSYIADAAASVTNELPAMDAGLSGMSLPALAPQRTSAEALISFDDRGAGILRDLVRVEVRNAVNDMAAGGAARGRL